MPRSKEYTTATTLVLDVLERVHDVGNATEAETAAENTGPCVCGVSRFIHNARHGPLSTGWAVCRGWSTSKVGNWCRVLVNSAAGLLRWHARLRLHVSLVLRLDILTLLLLWGRRASVLLLRLRVHALLLLLILLGSGVLVIHRRRWLLARNVGGHGILLHGDFVVLAGG